MPKLLNYLKRVGSGVLAGALVSLALAGIAVAAPPASASVFCVWQPLSLLNGWQSAQSDWNTGNPEYCVNNGIVYLDGSLKNPASTASTEEFAVLPSQALPTSTLIFAVYTYGGSVGQLDIFPNGGMYVVVGSNSGRYTSLAGISFPVAGNALFKLPLTNGWQSGQSQYGTGDPAEVTTDGIVHWTGSLTATNGTGTYADPGYFADTPGNAVPDSCLDFNVYTYGDHVGDLKIWPGTTNHPMDYGMRVYDITDPLQKYAQGFTSLAGVSYPELGHAAWQPLTLQPGWGPYNGGSPDYLPSCATAQTPSYYIQDGVVYLTGEIGGQGNGLIGTLPAVARPQHDLYLIVWGNDSPEYLHISPDGNMWVWGYPYQNGGNVISLANISYQT